MRNRFTGIICAVAICNVGSPAPVIAQEQQFQNLQVLPQNITRSELNEIMLDNLRGLGLPRLAGEGCLYCHDGDMDVPRREWDYASDANPMKDKARVMLRMMQEINATHLAQLGNRIDGDFQVTCYTCHTGRTDPRPLDTILLEAYDEGGQRQLASMYRRLRARFFGGDAYDFRSGTLTGIASTLMERGEADDAVRVARLNRDANDGNIGAERSWVQFRLLRTVTTLGVDNALAELDSLAPTLSERVMSSDILDGIAWGLIRSPREEDGRALVRANYLKFPGEYRAIESLAFVLDMEGDKDEAIALLERWLEFNPNHERARNLILNMRGS